MNEWMEFTFHDTGKVVKIRKVSPMLAIDIDASIPRPAPPTNRVDYGPPKGVVEEPNYNDPGFTEALSARNRRVGEMIRRAQVLRGVQVDGDAWQEEVKQYRAFMADTTGTPLAEASDLYLYVTRLCAGTNNDLTDLYTAITQRSQPTEEAVAAAKQSFPGDV